MLHAFFREVWPSEPRSSSPPGAADVETVAAVSLGDSFGVVALDGDRVIGYLGTLPLRVWDGAREQPGHWFKGFMVLPEFRNGPIGFGLVKEAVRHVQIALVITVQPASWRLFKAVGLVHVGALENRLRLLHPARVLRSIDAGRVGLPGVPAAAARLLRISQQLGLAGAVGGVMRIALAGWSLVLGSRSRAVKTRAVTEIDSDAYNSLWGRARTVLRFSQVRDANYVESRYIGPVASPYVLLEARDGEDLVGFAALRRPGRGDDPRLSGLAVAVLADMVVAGLRTDAIASLLGAAERAARELGADALVCSGSHPALLRALGARGYLRIPATLQFLARMKAGDAESAPLSDWWLLRADGNADEGF